MATLDKSLLLEMFRKMEEIRRMDLKIAQLVKKGKVPGMTHFSVGEEAANVGAMLALNDDDLLTSNHRGHGQAIAKGIDLNGMMAEILGNIRVLVKGRVAPCISLTSMLVTLVLTGSLVVVWELQ